MAEYAPSSGLLCHFIGLTISIIRMYLHERGGEIEEFRKRKRRERGRKNQWEGRGEGQEGGIEEGKSEREKEGERERGRGGVWYSLL